MVADDEANIRDFLRILLTGLGHTVVPVESAKAAGELLAQYQFDLLVTDLLMPDGDGLDLIVQFRQTQPSGSILAISGGGRYI